MNPYRIAFASLVAMALLLCFVTPAALGAEDLILGKKGKVHFTSDVQVGDVSLPAGTYKVQDLTEGSDHFVQFTQLEGKPEIEPCKVECSIEPLPKKVSRTTSFINPNGGESQLVRLQLKGENVALVF